MAVSPTQRSLGLLRDRGYAAQVVEKFVTWTQQRIDLFHFIDICAIKEDERGVVGVQTTSGAHTTERIKKIKTIPEAKIWLLAGNRILVHGWRKLKTRKDNKWWQVDEREITIEDIE